uniref:Uncharacterized protein n=1 Tax=Strigamia maritima TaxID=126957 RepID=T1J3U1_STRMM
MLCDPDIAPTGQLYGLDTSARPKCVRTTARTLPGWYALRTGHVDLCNKNYHYEDLPACGELLKSQAYEELVAYPAAKTYVRVLFNTIINICGNSDDEIQLKIDRGFKDGPLSNTLGKLLPIYQLWSLKNGASKNL